MMRVAALALLLVGAQAMPSFVVNLDLAPRERWAEVSKHYKDVLPGLMHAFVMNVSKMSWDAQSGFFENSGLSDELRAEVSGMVDICPGSQHVTERNLVLWNLVYELGLGPTLGAGSIATRPNGTVIQGRSLDFSFPFMLDGEKRDLRDYIFEVTFVAAGKPVATSVHWPGQVGVHTGLRFDGWSAALNADPRNSRQENLDAAKKGAPAASVALRQILLNATTFSNAVERIEHTRFMAPQGFVVAGAEPDAGAVFTTARRSLYAQPYTNAAALSSSMGRWFLGSATGHSNRWSETKSTDTTLIAQGQAGLSEGFMLRMMRLEPVSTDTTAFTWVSCPATGFHRAIMKSEPATLQPMRAPAVSFLHKGLQKLAAQSV